MFLSSFFCLSYIHWDDIVEKGQKLGFRKKIKWGCGWGGCIYVYTCIYIVYANI